MDDNIFSFGEAKSKKKSYLPQVQPEEIKKAELSEDDITILSFIEQYFWENKGKIPTVEYIAETLRYDLPLVQKAWSRPRLRDALIARGIVVSRRADGVLTPQQLLLVTILLNVEDKRSLRQKLKDVGVSVVQYNSWLRDPAFHNYIRLRSEEMFKNTDAEAYRALSDAATSGDVAALKLFFEMRGIYSPKLNVNINVESVVYKVVEIVAKHVKDPEALEAIAKEVEALELRPGA